MRRDADSHLYITIEAVFVALVGTIQKIITEDVRFKSKIGSDRVGSYYIKCLIMPSPRSQSKRTEIASAVMINIKRQGSVRKMVIITNL